MHNNLKNTCIHLVNLNFNQLGTYTFPFVMQNMRKEQLNTFFFQTNRRESIKRNCYINKYTYFIETHNSPMHHKVSRGAYIKMYLTVKIRNLKLPKQLACHHYKYFFINTSN